MAIFGPNLSSENEWVMQLDLPGEFCSGTTPCAVAQFWNWAISNGNLELVIQEQTLHHRGHRGPKGFKREPNFKIFMYSLANFS
jgi:hypothetical protein